LFTYCQSFPILCNYQIVISIPRQIVHLVYSNAIPIYQYVIYLVVSLPISIGPGVLMNVLVQEHHALNNHFFYVAKFTILTPLSLLS